MKREKKTLTFHTIINFYPNPIKDDLTIVSVSNKELKIELTNLIGETLYTLYKYRSAKVDVSNLAKGVYFLKVYCEKETIVKKFEKE